MRTKLWVTIALLSFTFVALMAALSEKKIDAAEAARLNNLGCAYMNQQLFEKALKYFEDAAALDTNLRVARVNQGIALLNLARVEPAKEALETAAKQNAEDPHVWYALGMLEKNSSQPEAAVQDFHRVTEIDDRDADTWYFLGTVYSQLKQFSQAIDAFEHALKLNPLHASAEFGLSRAYQQSADSGHARQHLARFQYITQNKLGSAMSLAYGEQGKYSLAEESQASALQTPPPIPVHFLDATAQAGLTVPGAEANAGDFGLGPGACFLDYDNDGNIDLFLPENGGRGMSLYHNLGNGKFQDATRQAGLDPATHAVSCTAGDYDNDGFTDLAIVVGGRVMLFHNEKNGTFKDATSRAGIKNSGSAIGVTFIDYDHDGDIDLYVTGAAEGGAQAASAGASIASPSPSSDEKLQELWRNNGNGSFTNQTAATGLRGMRPALAAIGTDYNNDRAVDIAVAGDRSIFENPREGRFTPRLLLVASGEDAHAAGSLPPGLGMAVLDFDHDGWMDIALTESARGGLSLWRNQQGRSFEPVKLPESNWVRAYGVAAFDYDNDGWVDLVAVGETREGKGEIRLYRNLGPDGFRDVTSQVGLDQIRLNHPRAIITGDYDNDGSTDLLITENQGPAVLLKNEGGDHHHWLRLGLKGLNDNKSAIGTKVEVFSDGIRQKFEIYGSNGYLGQNSPYLTVGLGEAKQADVVRMLWPTGVLQDEVEVAADRRQEYTELDRRGSSCPTLFAWNGTGYELVADILGAGVIGHWVSPGERNIPRPVEYVKVDRHLIREKNGKLSFRLIEPMEEVVYLDQVKLLAVDHPADIEVYPNEYFASQPPYPEFKVIASRHAQPPAAAWDDRGRDLRPDLVARRYVSDFELLPFKGFAKPHSLTLDLGQPYQGGPLLLLMHGEIEYFTATGMYAAWQAGIEATPPYVDAEVPEEGRSRWVRVSSDIGFPAGLPRTITVNLGRKLPPGTRRIRITTNLQIYWDSILIDRSKQSRDLRVGNVPLTGARLGYHGYPRQIEDQPPGNVKYVYGEVSRTGPYARQAGSYTRYGDVLALLAGFDDRLVVFGSGEEVSLEFNAPSLLPVKPGWTRDYFFMARGYEKDMDFYAADANTVEPLPFRDMRTYPDPTRAFPSDDEHTGYRLEYNTRFVSGREPRSYAYEFESLPDR
jgi:tetratricopeptide (TPR) repeat protein